MKPKLLDLFCCAGGAGMGYARAGFDVTGVDIVPRPRYPFAFVQADVLTLDPEWIAANFDAVHASPPCQFATEMNNDKSAHENLVPATRDLLTATGLPYVIENVRAARDHLINPVSLFGTMFDCHMVTSGGQRFVLSRERLFEANWPIRIPHNRGAAGDPIANVFGGHLRCRSKAYRTGNGTGRTRDFIGEDKPALARQLMGMPWASMGEMSEAVPPAYTNWIGKQLLSALCAAHGHDDSGPARKCDTSASLGRDSHAPRSCGRTDNASSEYLPRTACGETDASFPRLIPPQGAGGSHNV